ncbi:MAG: PH domain-containing protein [Candidatus Abawacabacteria bacterium]|nr:PH domain-containing protein [Candidatus Abawacabacteria bacterium]
MFIAEPIPSTPLPEEVPTDVQVEQSKKKEADFKPIVIRKSLVVMVVKAVLFSIIAFAIVTIGYLCLLWTDLLSARALLILIVILLCLEFAIFVYLGIEWYTKYYILRKDTLGYISGLLFHKERDFSLANVASVTLHEGILGQIFGYGSVKVLCPDIAGGEEVYLSDIPKPKSVVRAIEEIAIKNEVSEQQVRKAIHKL